MKKTTSIFIFLALNLLAFSVFAQVQITGGKFDMSGGAFVSGSASMQSELFSSTGSLNSSVSPWSNICPALDCNPGDTFGTPFGLQIGDSGYRRGTFTINGTTYSDVYYSGNLNIEPVTFQIPRINQRKGLITLRKPFKMDGIFKACRTNDFVSGCPSGDVLFDGTITAQGDLTVTMRIKQTMVSDRVLVYLQPERFEYQFKP